MSKFGIATLWVLSSIILTSFFTRAVAEEHTVYEVFRAVDLGESDQPPPRDIFVNIGSANGVKKGTVLDVYRKVSSFDNLTEKVAGDHIIPVGRMKVIHSDVKTAIARIEKFVSVEQEPALLPQTVMIGDIVKPAN